MLLSTAAGNCSPACAPCGRIPGRWGFWPGPKSPSGDEYFVHIARVRGAAGNLRTRLLCSSYVQISSQTAGNEKEQGALTSSVHWYHERALSVRLESRGRRDIERTLLAGLGCLAHRLESRGRRDIERTLLAGLCCLAHRLESRGCRDVERTPLAGLGCLAHRFPAQLPMVARGYSPLTGTISASKSSHLSSEESLTGLQGVPLLTTGDKRGNARQLPWIHSALWDTVEGSLRKYDA